jgi:hypothetical protein
MYKTAITVPAVLCKCKHLPLKLRGENRLRVIENRVLRRMFGYDRDKERGGWRKLHNDELGNVCSSTILLGLADQ